jgi:hypothetical protein
VVDLLLMARVSYHDHETGPVRQDQTCVLIISGSSSSPSID